MDTVPPQPSPIVYKALLSPRPKGHESHPYPQSDIRGERCESQPLSPPPYSRRLLGGEEGREGAGDRSRAERWRQGNSGSFSAAADRTKTLLPARPLTSCPLPARPLGYGRPLPTCGHRNATRNLHSGRAWNRHHSTKVHRGPTGSTRSPMTSHCSSMPTLTRTGNKAAHTIFHDHGNPPMPCGPLAIARPAVQAGPICRLTWPMYTGQGSHTPATSWHQPSPGFHWGPDLWDYTQATWHGGSPRPQPTTWDHANGSGRGPAVGLPPAGNPPPARIRSTSDSSETETRSRNRSKGKRHRREASISSNKRRKTGHSSDWRSSSASSESEDADLGTPCPLGGPSGFRDGDLSGRSRNTSDSLTVGDASSTYRAKPHTSSEPIPSTSTKETSFWPDSPREQEGDHTYLCLYMYIYVPMYMHASVFICYVNV